ncbi:MAG TPA: calcium/sodium antiporter [Phycisphaerae bacterium]|nr:calcium/sodium antiporter [Phycisphaerae bacterium]HPS52178.1 calcium/sodium antiporter [Phycisphaerae bacterium]
MKLFFIRMMIAEIISDSFFEAQLDADRIWLLWLMVLSSVLLLVYGADKLVAAAVQIARSLGFSPVIIGATIVSLGTTAPETFVSVTAAFSNNPGLALGNGVGSIICDTALIFGLACCLCRLPKNRFLLVRQGWLQLAAGTLLTASFLVLAWMKGSFYGVVMPRWMGFSFVVLLIGYMGISAHWARLHPEIIPEEAMDGQNNGRPTRKSKFGAVAVMLVTMAMGLLLVLLGSDIMVGSTARICIHYGVPESVLAVTLVAFGTSLPELVTAIVSIIKGHPELLVGNIIGADILNVLFVIGASAAATPLLVPTEFFYLHLPVMMAALILLRLFIFAKGDRFHRWYGIPFLSLFAGYLAILFVMISTGHLKLHG